MGFLDKVKNMFTEEVEDDSVKVEQVKKEVTHVTIESPVEKEEDNYKEDMNDFNYHPVEKSSKPIFFDDNDFKDLNLTPKKEEKINHFEEKEIYGSKIVQEKPVEEKKVFKPTPIISPVYGVLDKNYHKEDIISRKETSEVVTSTEPSIDTIRNKAYGTLEDELENTLFGSNSILFKKDKEEDSDKDNEHIEEVDDDYLSNLTDDISKELDELLIKKEKYSDEENKQAKKNDESLAEDDLLGFIDSTLYKDGDEE